jgi:KDO2-lipid IV(A) lauroyltransferase
MLRRIGPLLPIARTARDNLNRAFPDWTNTEIAGLLDGMWDHLGRVAAEHPHLASIATGDGGRRIETAGEEHLLRLRNRPVIFVSAHFGNWELCPALLSRLGLPFTAVVRPPNNPYVARHLAALRQSSATGRFVAKGAGAGRAAASALARGEAVALLADQRRSKGIEIRFLGRPALATGTPAVLALRFGAAVVPGRIERVDGVRFRAIFDRPLDPPASGDRTEQVRALTQAIADRIEVWVRERPEQWLWTHRRWRM